MRETGDHNMVNINTVTVYVPLSMPNGQPYKTTLHHLFNVVEQGSDTEAVEKLFNEFFETYAHDIETLTELAVVVNIRSWFWYDKDDNLGRLYSDLYYRVYDYVYADNAPFNHEEQGYFFSMTD